MDHTVLPAITPMPAFTSEAFTRWRLPDRGCRYLIAAYYSFIYPETMKGWVCLVGWPTVDGLPT